MSSSLKEFDHLRISLKEIEVATDNFSDENVIGKGSSATVYKGQLLRSEALINVTAKRLDFNSGQGDVEFLMEISILSSLEHENIISIIGFCDENNEKIIIKKHEANKSLDKYLSSPTTLTWMQRLHICVGAASALSYVHFKEERNYGIIHRNIKSSKILLDENWNAKVSGFEHSLVNPVSRKHRLLLSPTRGTFGYVDPVSINTGSVTYKSDSYSFGMVLFEVLCGRLCFNENEDDEKRFLGPLAKLHYDEGKLDEIIPLELRRQMDPKSLSIFSETAYCCLKEQRTQRPSMDQIARQLTRAMEFQLKREKPEDPKIAIRSLSIHFKENLEHLKIPLKDIKLATNNFDEMKCIGQGGFGKVYKAELEYFDNKIQGVDQEVVPKKRNNVAIKRISSRQQGEHGFLTEIEMLTICEHPNIISLLGFCAEDQEMILVYEHASNGSLDDYLESIDHMTNLTWSERLRMCLDIGEGLNYLHTKDKQRIIHRDIKSANILLDDKWTAKIADFGLSKFGPMHQPVSYLETKVAGTNVYLDPEYANTGVLKRESDIYSFGVVLFEILCGRLAYDEIYNVGNDKGLPSIARRCFNEKTLKGIIDPKILEETDENVFTLNKGPNEESLNTFFKIAYQCLAETQAKRPTMEVVIKELQKALDLQVNRVDILKISHKQIELATENFSDTNLIGKGAFGDVYRGEVVQAHRRSSVAVKRHVATRGQGDQEFLTELEILFEFKHENVIGLVGYYNEMDEKIIVYEHAHHGSVDRYLNDACLTWAKRIKICIDVASGLNFLHGGVGSQEMVIHRDIKSSNILLNCNWKAKISDFGLSIITPINQHMNHVICNPVGTPGYVDRIYVETGFLTKECDIFSLGMVLLEIMCGKSVFFLQNGKFWSLENLFKRSYEEGKVDEIVFDGIKGKMVPGSLSVFSKIVYRCLHDERKQRLTAEQVIRQLKEALEIQEDYDIWEPKLPRDYKELIRNSRFPDIPLENKKDLYDMLSIGILLQNGKVWFSLSVDGMRNEMISATMFSYNNQNSFKWCSTQNSRFPRVATMLDISDMNIEVKITPKFLSRDIVYGVYVVFKFCDPRKLSSKPVYVNLKYKMGSKTLYSYFATWRDNEWMMIQLDAFLNCKETIDFEVLLESFSQNCCGSGAIFVEGIEFRAIDNVKDGDMEKSKKLQKVLKSNSNMDNVQLLPYDNNEVINRSKIFLPTKVNEKKFHMLPAKMILYDSYNVKRFNWIPLSESRFVEGAELLAHQTVLRIKCKIESQRLSSDTDYACYLVFKLSRGCHGLQCPVKVRNILLKGSKEKTNVLYFRSPSSISVHGIRKVPEQREDGLMEVIVSEFNSSCELNNEHLPMNLKLKCYEGTMSGLIVYGMEFRAI